MSDNTIIIPVLGAQYLANPKEKTASLTKAERDARTIALLEEVKETGGMVMLIPEPTNRHNPDAVLARHKGVSVGYVGDDYLETVQRLVKGNGGRPLLARVREVNVYEHGYLYVELADAAEVARGSVLHEVDWSAWMVDVPLLPFTEEQLCQTEAQMMLEITPFCHESLEQLSFNIELWMKGSTNDLSYEAREQRSRYIELLETASDADVRLLAENVKHQRNAICGVRMMTERTEVWWQKLLHSCDMQDLWQRWQLRCEHRYWDNLRMIDNMLRQLPGEAYEDIGDLGKFLSRLYYMKVPVVAYYSILTLMLIRQLTCRELGIANMPLTEGDYLSDDVIQDMEQIPVTIGQVLRFGHTQCEMSGQRATVQLLAYWLRDEYNNSHCKAADALTQRDEDIRELTGAVKEQTKTLTAIASKPTTIGQLNMGNGKQELPPNTNIPLIEEQ